MNDHFPTFAREMFLGAGFTLVEPGTSVGVKLGFRSKDWREDSFIARKGELVILPLLAARHPGTGTFARLLAHLDQRHMQVAISSPTGRFRDYLERRGWEPVGTSLFGELWGRKGQWS